MTEPWASGTPTDPPLGGVWLEPNKDNEPPPIYGFWGIVLAEPA